MAATAGAVHLRGVLERVERHADRAVADGVDLRPAGRHDRRPRPPIEVLLRQEGAAVAAADVGLEHHRGLRVDGAVEDQLGEPAGVQRAARGIAVGHVAAERALARPLLERYRRPVTHRQPVAGDGARDRGTLVVCKAALGGVLQRGESERCGSGHLAEQQLVGVLGRQFGQQVAHQAGGAFLEQAGRFAVGVAHDDAVRRGRACRASPLRVAARACWPAPGARRGRGSRRDGPGRLRRGSACARCCPGSRAASSRGR